MGGDCKKCGAKRIDYQLGLEKTPEEYVSKLVTIMREVKRVLKDDGTLWLNLGDSYTGGNPGHNPGSPKQQTNRGSNGEQRATKMPPGLKPKDLIGIPWMVAFALRADGWFLRSDIIWAKPNCMPESVEDRPTRSHEYIFLLSKSKAYYYDFGAIKEPCSESFTNDSRWNTGSTDRNEKEGYAKSKAQNPKAVHRLFDKQKNGNRTYEGFNGRWDSSEANGTAPLTRNKRDVWWVSPASFNEAHFATFPPTLITPCILAGCPAGGTVIDPFFGAGTTGLVSLELGRNCIGIELNADYVKMAEARCNVTQGLPL